MAINKRRGFYTEHKAPLNALRGMKTMMLISLEFKRPGEFMTRCIKAVLEAHGGRTLTYSHSLCWFSISLVKRSPGTSTSRVLVCDDVVSQEKNVFATLKLKPLKVNLEGNEWNI